MKTIEPSKTASSLPQDASKVIMNAVQHRFKNVTNSANLRRLDYLEKCQLAGDVITGQTINKTKEISMKKYGRDSL